jgi:hypothetical protein
MAGLDDLHGEEGVDGSSPSEGFHKKIRISRVFVVNAGAGF